MVRSLRSQWLNVALVVVAVALVAVRLQAHGAKGRMKKVQKVD